MIKTYDVQKKIAELLQSYKQCKNNEKELLSNAAIKKRIISELEEDEAEKFSEIDARIQEEQEKAKEEKKRLKEGMEIIKNSIVSELENDRKNDGRDVKEETLIFTGIGSVSYKKVTQYVTEYTDEEKDDLINDIIKNGLYDLLEINEEKLIEMSKELKKETGKHIKGVREFDVYETKIR